MLGWTQKQLADELGVTQGYVSSIENGRGVRTRDLLRRIATALRVPLTTLTQSVPGEDVTGANETIHLAVPQIRAALDGAEAPSHTTVEQLVTDVESIQIARMACDYRVLADMVPTVLADTHHHADRTTDPQAISLHVRVCVAGAITVRPLGYLDLAVRLAERAQATARICDDPVLRAAADYTAAQASLAGGLPSQRRRSLELATTAADRITSLGTDDAKVWYGMCHLQAALSAAGNGYLPQAQAHLAEAAGVAAGRPADSWVQEFSPANVAMWGLAVALEADDAGSALAAMRSVDRGQLRTRQRRARFYGDAARALHNAEKPRQAITCLLRALDISPLDVRSRAVLRDMVRTMVISGERDARLMMVAQRMRIDPLELNAA